MKLNFFAGVEYKNQIYFSEYNNLNGLFLFNMESQEVRFLKLFEKEEVKPRLHRSAFLYNNEAWFIPQEASYIANINLDTLDITYYKMPFNKKSEKEVGHYCPYINGHVVQNKYLYLIPHDIDTVLIIDMELHKFYPYYGVINVEEETMIDGVIIKDDLFLLPAVGKFYIKLNLRTNKWQRIKWEYGEWAFSSVQLVDEKIWILPISQKYILTVELKTGVKHKLPLLNPKDQYWNMMLVDNELIFFPYQASNFLIVDKNTLEMRIDKMEGHEEIFFVNPNIVSRIKSKEKKLITMGLAEYIIIFDENKSVVTLEINTKCFFTQLGEYLKSKGNLCDALIEQEIAKLSCMVRMNETAIYQDLECFFSLDAILNGLPYSNGSLHNSENIGNKIWCGILNNEI